MHQQLKSATNELRPPLANQHGLISIAVVACRGRAALLVGDALANVAACRGRVDLTLVINLCCLETHPCRLTIRTTGYEGQ
jgi:hypothetical protein